MKRLALLLLVTAQLHAATTYFYLYKTDDGTTASQQQIAVSGTNKIVLIYNGSAITTNGAVLSLFTNDSEYATNSAIQSALAGKLADPGGTTGYVLTRTNSSWAAMPIIQSSTFQSTRAQTDASGNYTWTFTTPFVAAPKITALAETSAAGMFNVQLTAVTTTNATFKAIRTTSVTVALVGLDLLQFNNSPQCYLHLTAQ